MTTATESKIIRRNATKKQAAIFAAVKTAKLHCRSNNYTAVPFTNVERLQEFYNESPKARLYETGEGEYYLSICPEEWFIFSTNEPTPQPQPEAAPKLVVAPTAPVAEVAEVAEVEVTPAPTPAAAPTVSIESLQAEIESLRKQLAQATAPGKAAIQSITMRRAEGPHSECVTRTATDWVQADAILRQWAKTAPATGGTNKCDLTLLFADGESFNTGIELQQSHVFTLTLAKHVLDALRFMAGEDSGSLTTEQYQQWLNQPWAKPTIYKQLLSQWLIPA